jgi:hypothetical protein
VALERTEIGVFCRFAANNSAHCDHGRLPVMQNSSHGQGVASEASEEYRQRNLDGQWRKHYTMFRHRLPPIFQLATVSTRVNSN